MVCHGIHAEGRSDLMPLVSLENDYRERPACNLEVGERVKIASSFQLGGKSPINAGWPLGAEGRVGILLQVSYDSFGRVEIPW